MRIPSGSVDRYLYFVAVDATDLKSRETGLATWTVYRSRNGGAAAAFTTPTINETDAANMPGVYELLLDEDTTIAAGNDAEEMVVHITHAGMAPVTRSFELYRPETTEGNTLGVAADGDISGNLDGTVATVTTLTGHTAQTGDSFARLGAPAGASVSADIAGVQTDTTAIVADTNELQTDWADGGRLDVILDACSTLTAAAVNAEVDTALADIHLDHLLAVDYDPAAKPGIATALLNELIENNAGVSRLTAAALNQTWSVGTRTLTAATNITSDASAITMSSAGVVGTVNLVNTVTTNTDMRGTDSALLAASAPTNFGDLAITVTTGQVTVGTNNDKTGYSISGTKTTLDALNDVAATDIVSGGAITTSGGAVSTVTTTTTATSVTNAVTVGTINDGAVDATVVADIFSTTTLTESYATLGAAGTPAQILYFVQQFLTENGYSGTTGTIKKLDGATTAATTTLDDGTTPTSITRAS